MKIFVIRCVVGVMLLAGAAQATLIAYEGFDYSETPGGINTATLSGGSGLSGSWVSTDSAGASPFFEITSPGESWGALGVLGNRMHRIATGGVEAVSRTISNDVDQAVELWFSVLHDADATSQFAVGGGSFVDGSSGGGILTSGPGFGIRATGNDTGTVAARIWENDGTTAATGGTVDFGDGLRLFVGHVQFNAAGGEDLFALYSVGTDLLLPLAPFSTVQADVDETLLDTLTMSTNRGPGFDEIRLGTTMEDVGVVGVVPEPSSLFLLMSGGAMMAMFRRRVVRGRA